MYQLILASFPGPTQFLGGAWDMAYKYMHDKYAWGFQVGSMETSLGTGLNAMCKHNFSLVPRTGPIIGQGLEMSVAYHEQN